MLWKCVCLFFISFLFSALLLRPLIALLQKKHLGQCILEIGPAWHKPKEGTPTMGGSVFLLTVPLFSILGCFLMEGMLSKTLLFILLFALANGLIGLLDDGTKFKNHQNQGLLPWQKLFLQSLFVAAFFYLLLRFGEGNYDVFLPYVRYYVPWGIPLLFFFFLAALGILNSANLSDGVDGLTASSALVIGIFFAFWGVVFSESALLSLGISLSGTMLGFLLFNRHPAKIFMGDTGSLFLGALTVGAAFLTENPAVLPIYTFLFLLEGGSVILQVLVFKRTGKRLFRMAPLHHHLEKSGWSENKIVLVFSFITLLACLFAHLALL